MTEYYLVDVKSISSNQRRSSFNENDLDKLARSILDSEILLKPLILNQTGPESYEVIDGNFEYYSAVRAKEINPRGGEMVSAFVISPKDQKNITEQLSILNAAINRTVSSPSIPINNTESDQRLSNLEAHVDRAIADIKDESRKEFQRLNNQITDLKTQLPQKIEALEVLNNFGKVELTLKLQMASIKGKTAEKIITSILKERKKQGFSSFSDVVKRVEGLGDKRMVAILDAWNGTF
ncbi:MAG: hypothetical protein HC851_05270 [Acaryochloris sp. RU_4_1]|nr:hypothetical protein [Acaryochloris sp. RU_4_1]